MHSKLSPHTCLKYDDGVAVLIEHDHLFKSMTNDIESYMDVYQVDKVIYFSNSDKQWNVAEGNRRRIVFSSPSEEEIKSLNIKYDIISS